MEAPPDPRTSDKSVKTLDWSYSALSSVPNTVFSLVHLSSLRLDNNNLATVEWTLFMQLPNLKVLDLSHNKIADLPRLVAHWNTIEVLNLCHNRISELPTPDVWRLFPRCDYIIPIVHKGTPAVDLRSPEATKELQRKYGDHMPRTLQYTWREYDSDIYSGGSSWNVTRWVTLGQGYWERHEAKEPRLRLEGNPVWDRIPRLATDWEAVYAEWKSTEEEAAAREEKSTKEEQAAEKATKEEQKGARRRAERAKDKGTSRDRDAKYNPP